MSRSYLFCRREDQPSSGTEAESAADKGELLVQPSGQIRVGDEVSPEGDAVSGPLDVRTRALAVERAGREEDGRVGGVRVGEGVGPVVREGRGRDAARDGTELEGVDACQESGRRGWEEKGRRTTSLEATTPSARPVDE